MGVVNQTLSMRLDGSWEGSAKNLRGDSMSDVIFNGSVARPASSRASVELVFDNSSGDSEGDILAILKFLLKDK